MPAKARTRRSRGRSAAIAAFTPGLAEAIGDAAGLAGGTRAQRAALSRAVHAELCDYLAAVQVTRPGGPGGRAAISELMRAAEAMLRALGDLDPHTVALLTDGDGGIDMVAWATDLHRLWDRLLALDRRLDAQESGGHVPRRDLERATIGRLIDTYRAHGGGTGDLLTFLRQTCACVALPLPKTDEKLIALISQLPTLV